MDNNQPTNPPSGTVVDDVVTLPERYDFFLVSQSVRQGTVNPTSYNVIIDGSGLKPEHIQKLTYKVSMLCMKENLKNWSISLLTFWSEQVCSVLTNYRQLVWSLVNVSLFSCVIKYYFQLTHLYYNWPGTVRVPAPCQYAHKLAFLVGESLHMEPGSKLEDTLYYL